MPSTRRRRQARPARGGLLLSLLFVLAVMALASAATLRLGSVLQRHEAEEELLFIGLQFRNALRSWYDNAPPGLANARGPQRLEDLLQDPRSLQLRRHLRRLPPDPITGRADWVLLRDAGGAIIGLRSASAREVLRQANFPPDLFYLAHKRRYSDWVFVWGVICTTQGCQLPNQGNT